MSKKLAIKGHPTRGKEVIEILEMMGGKNIYKLLGNDRYAYCVIEGCQNEIRVGEYIFGDEDMCFFTLEEFLEKYPFKVGDKVIDSKTGKIAEVYKINWSENNSRIYYDIKYPNNNGCQRGVMDLESYKETNMNENKLCTAVNYIMKPEVNADGMLCYKIPDGYESFSIQEGTIILKPKKPTYPKTIIEVLDYWHPNRKPEDDYQYIYKKELIKSFQLLLYCRDAYWKIAGEEMGLDEPWEPNWTTFEGMPAIFRFRYNIVCDSVKNQHCLLVFPTEEMRDAFYKNFKDLIEQCKELL